MALNQIKVDFHTHSVATPDGGISAADYAKALDSGKLNAIAITDHDQVDFALNMAKERPTQIIVGEEIMTRDGEIIGLFLSERVPPGLSATETVQLIKAQNAIVYVPHPLEKMRKGLSLDTLEIISPHVSVVEQYNGRAFRTNKSKLRAWAESKGIPMLASSDAHSPVDLGRTYTLMNQIPTIDYFHSLADSATTVYKPATIRGRLAPTLNHFKKR